MIPALPSSLAPPAPFPLVLAQSREDEFVAPGVRRATYRLTTNAGPIVVSVVAIDTAEPTIRLDAVVASDRMISRGETLSSMAARTGAIAGINADYFDIGNTNQPLNLVVRSGELQRTPSRRIVLAVHRDRTVRFERATFSGTVAFGGATVPLTTVNEWPPQGGAGLITRAYGERKDVPGVSVVSLARTAAASAAGLDGTYRVVASGAGPLGLAFGPAALAVAAPPAIGDAVTISTSLSPSLADVTGAVGGGPLLVARGAPASDPFAPAPEESGRRFPVSGAGTAANGELLLASVDGRQNALSVGLTRPEFASLWIGLGATEAMAFDSGGSAELVARKLGDRSTSVLGSPSDGQERAVADGLFVYSDAPAGPATRLVVRPHEIVALPGVDVPIALALADASGHGLGAAHLDGGDFVRAGSASSVDTIRAGGLSARVPVRVVDTPAALTIVYDQSNPDPGTIVHLSARAFDRNGQPIAVGDRARFTTTHGTFVAPGDLRVDAHDATVTAYVAGLRTTALVPVGNHEAPLDIFSDDTANRWHVALVPPNGSASLGVSGGELALMYDFTDDARAAYANGDFLLPGTPERFALDVRGDASGIGVRAAFVNRFGEKRALTLAKTVDWTGWRRVTIALPPDLNPPVRLVALYAFNGLDGIATHARGSLHFRNASVTAAGTP